MSVPRQHPGFIVIVCSLLLIPTRVWGVDSWVQLGQYLKASASTFVDIDASRHAQSPSLASDANTLYLAWTELNTHGIPQVHVNYWRQDGWITLGRVLNVDPTRPAFDPVIVTAHSTPYVAWVELNKKAVAQLYIKRWTQGGWALVGGSLNQDPTRATSSPSMAVGLGRPYVAWTEANERRTYQVHVKWLTENGWVKLGDSLNENPERDGIEPSISVVGSTPYVAWCEKAANGHFQVYVKHWTGEAWIRDGESLNVDPSAHALSPSIASDGTVPYVTWVEFNEKGIAQVYMKQWMNDRWILMGSLNVDPGHHAFSPSLAFRNNVPYVAWAESDSSGVTQIRVTHWTGSNWAPEAETLNLDATRLALSPVLAFVGERPFVAWKEYDEAGLFGIVVKARR